MKTWIIFRPDTFKYDGKWIRNWFSNMVLCKIIYNGITYNSVENFYQAHKTLIEQEHKSIASVLSPQESKKAGRMVKVRPDWKEVKYGVMKTGLYLKFNQPEWKEKLMATGDTVIIEWNNWGDEIWGVNIKNNRGQNLLGQALMEIRADFVRDSLNK